MKILITGSTGLLGQALVARLSRSAEHDVVGLSRHAPTATPGGAHAVCDLTDAPATERLLRHLRPACVVHCQALSDVDRCEQDPDEARRLNVQTIEHLCRALAGSSALLISLSTDYVFDGAKGRPYDESDEPSPLSVYGRAKRAAERVALGYEHGMVVRPSTLFGSGRHNFCNTIVERLQAGAPVEAFTDQTTSPTLTDDLADGIAELIRAAQGPARSAAPRIYHIANAHGCRRIDFARRVAELLGFDQSLVLAIRMAQQARPARRPAYTVLASRHFEPTTGRTLRGWDEALHAYLRQRRWLA